MATAKPLVPWVIERYVYVRLLGKRDAGRHPDDEIDPKRFVDPWEMADPPLDGLYRQRREALCESTKCSEQLAELYFDCPGCGNGPHLHPEDRLYVEYLQEERSCADKAADKFGLEIALLNRLIDPDLTTITENSLTCRP